ncbi:sel1 repeat family protein [bacterium]|nr:sel1 repeat family protein [bacterium]
MKSISINLVILFTASIAFGQTQELLSSTGDAKETVQTLDQASNSVLSFDDWTLAAKLIEGSADKGEVNSQYLTGKFYQTGTGVNQSDKKAVGWFKKASAQGDADSQYELALAYKNGDGVFKSSKNRFEWVKKAAESGNVEAQYILGYLYQEGKGVTKNETESLNWYNRAATANKPNSLSAFRLANHLIKNGINQITDRENIVEAYYWILIAINNAYHRDVSKTDLEEMHKLRGELYAAMQGNELIKSLKQYSVIEKLRTATQKKDTEIAKIKSAKNLRKLIVLLLRSKKGDSKAQVKLAYNWDKGLLGLEKNSQNSLQLYTTAASNGDLFALNNLGRAVFVNDKVSAFQNFAKGAKSGNATSKYNLGIAYANGSGIEKNIELAKQNYEYAAKLGLSQAQLYLGHIYYSGALTGEKNNTMAFQWFEIAALAGHKEAQAIMGIGYTTGEAREVDREKAFKWFELAANQGDPASQVNLGINYENGYGVDLDIDKAISWYRKSADQNYSGAQVALGNVYFNGKGITRDYKKAIEWYEAGSKQGHLDSIYFLGKMHYNGKGVNRDLDQARNILQKAVDKQHQLSVDLMNQIIAEQKIIKTASNNGNDESVALNTSDIVDEDNVLAANDLDETTSDNEEELADYDHVEVVADSKGSSFSMLTLAIIIIGYGLFFPIIKNL